MNTRSPSLCAILCRSRTLLALLVAVLSLAAACTSEPVDGGTDGTGASSGLGGLGGTTCQVPDELDARPFEVALREVGGFGGQGGAGELGDSGCVAEDEPATQFTCQGLAEVSLGASGPVLELGDGSTFSWRLDDFDAGLLAEESVVWLEYVQEEHVICPFCGSVSWRTLIVHDALDEDRTLIYWTFNERGDLLRGMTDALGVEVTGALGCSVPGQADCHVDVTTTYFDMVIASSPEERVLAGEVAQVTTPRGTFDFYSRLYSQTGTFDQGCSDGRGLQSGGPILIIQQ